MVLYGDRMIWYHGTSKENWDKIQQEGILWGRRFVINNDGNIIKEVRRCTYLTPDLEEAKHYGDVILKVEYNPFDDKGRIKKDKRKPLNNYVPDCWQMRVYEPISIDSIKLITMENKVNKEPLYTQEDIISANKIMVQRRKQKDTNK